MPPPATVQLFILLTFCHCDGDWFLLRELLWSALRPSTVQGIGLHRLGLFVVAMG